MTVGKTTPSPYPGLQVWWIEGGKVMKIKEKAAA